MAKDFYGLFDPSVEEAFTGIAEVSGEAAFDTLYKIFSRIGQKRFDNFKDLLDTIRFFGCRISFVHKDDLSESDFDTYGVTNSEVSTVKEKVQGYFRPIDFWIEIALHNLSNFSTFEEVLRHEVIHLLQEMTRNKSNQENMLPKEDTHLLLDVVKYGTSLANLFREHADEYNVEVFEVEAYSMQTWRSSVRDWSSEIMKNEALWTGHACSIID